MAKNTNRNIIIGVVITLVLVLFLFQGKGVEEKTEIKTEEQQKVSPSTSQGGLGLDAYVSDALGNRLSSTVAPAFAIVTFQGESPTIGARYVTIKSTLTASGNVPSINVNSISGIPGLYNTKIGEQMTKSFTLTQGQTNSQQVVLDFTDASIPYGQTTFQMTIGATFKNAQGVDVTVTPTPTATVSILKEKDTCSDATPWGECSPNKPKYCQPGQLQESAQIPYVAGSLIDKASVCGCPVGYVQNPSNVEQCILNACSDGTLVNQCSSAPNTNLRYCTSSRTLVEACGTCGGAIACTKDYYNNNATSCSAPNATDGTDVCTYQIYSGTIDVSIGSGGASPPPVSAVRFRTTDLPYSGTAVAYTSTCGSALTGYGYNGATGLLSGTCTTGSKTWCGTSSALVLPNLPGGWKAGGENPSLWKPTEAGIVCVCDDTGTQYQLLRFETIDNQASEISTSSSVINSALELTC